MSECKPLLHGTTDKELWTRDLDAFEDAMDVFDEEDAKLAADLEKQLNAAKRNATKGGKKVERCRLTLSNLC